MKRALIISVCSIISFFIAGVVFANNTYYARCNIKVLKGNQISRVNCQAAPYTTSLVSRLKVTRSGETATFVKEDNGESYKIGFGADGDAYIEKFVTRKPINISKFTNDVQSI